MPAPPPEPATEADDEAFGEICRWLRRMGYRMHADRFGRTVVIDKRTGKRVYIP